MITVHVKSGSWVNFAHYVQNYIDTNNEFGGHGKDEDLLMAIIRSEKQIDDKEHTEEHYVTVDDCKQYIDNIRKVF